MVNIYKALNEITELIGSLVRAADRIFGGAGAGAGAIKKQWVQSVAIYALTELKKVKISDNAFVERMIDYLIEMAVVRVREFDTTYGQPGTGVAATTSTSPAGTTFTVGDVTTP